MDVGNDVKFSPWMEDNNQQHALSDLYNCNYSFLSFSLFWYLRYLTDLLITINDNIQTV